MGVEHEYDVEKKLKLEREKFDEGYNVGFQHGYEKGYADRENKIVPVTLEMDERHTTRQIKGYLDKATQTIYANSITVDCAEAIGWKIKEGVSK